MIEIHVAYEGQLRCRAQHCQSGNELVTDAPLDNQGKGESFSPTDLMAAALGSCMETIMGIAAENRGVDLTGLKVVVKKHMSEDIPRRISQLEVEIFMPIQESHPEKKVLQSAALSCPVHHSIHPDIEVPITWRWADDAASADPQEFVTQPVLTPSSPESEAPVSAAVSMQAESQPESQSEISPVGVFNAVTDEENRQGDAETPDQQDEEAQISNWLERITGGGAHS